jgi:hypothetical protein
VTKRSKEPQKVTVDKKKASKKRKRPDGVARKGLAEALPTSVQKSYFLLKDAERNVLNLGLQKFRPGQSDPIFIGGKNLLKPALKLMSFYRLRIDEIKGGRSRYQLYPVAGIRPSEGTGKSGSLCDVQSVFRAHLAGIEETVAGACCQRTCQYWPAKPIFDSPVQLGEKVRIGKEEAHLFGRTSEGARAGIGKRRRRKCHPRTSAPCLGELSPAGIRCCDSGDQQEDGLEDRNRLTGAIKTSAGDVTDVYD